MDIETVLQKLVEGDLQEECSHQKRKEHSRMGCIMGMLSHLGLTVWKVIRQEDFMLMGKERESFIFKVNRMNEVIFEKAYFHKTFSFKEL